MTRQIANNLFILMIFWFGSVTCAQAANRDEIVFFLPDAIGSAIAAVNENGDLCWREVYTPYGDKLVNNDAVAELGMPAGCGLLGEERGFTGHTEDFESDLVYAQQRYYDPTVGRFMSIDPAPIDPFDVRTINRYSYAANNPYRYTDPTGEFFTPETVWDAINVGIGVDSYLSNVNSGNYFAAATDFVGIGVDGFATVLPFVPGFAGTLIQSSRLGDVAQGTGPWGKVGGHHVHAKAAFKENLSYNNKDGFSISQNFMKENGLDHSAMTRYQRQAFKKLSESGGVNNMEAHTRIAVDALQAGGASLEMARSLTAQSLNALRNSGVTTPSNIPWYK